MVRSKQTARMSSVPQYNIHVYHQAEDSDEEIDEEILMEGPFDVSVPPPVIALDSDGEEKVGAPIVAVEEPQVDPVEVPPLAAEAEAQAEANVGADHPVQPISPCQRGGQ
ncbi:unnamed protein product [Urochloa humidicola]